MNRVKELRKAAELKQLDIAKQIEVVQATVSGWENQQYDPSGESLWKLARLFDVSLDYLLCRSDIKKPPTPEGMSGLTPKQLKILEMMDQMTPAQQDEMVRQAEYQLWQQQNGKGGQ